MSVALRQRIETRAAAHLQPGEVIQQSFAAQTVNPYWSLVSILIILVQNAYRAVVVTDRRIIVFQSSRWGYSYLKTVLREFPRTTQIGPVEGTLWSRNEALGERLYIHRRFFKDIQGADADAGAPQA